MIIGHQKHLDYLTQSIAAKTLVGSYLFYGKEHLGKTTVAEWFIEKIIGGQAMVNHPDVTRLSPPIDLKSKKTSAIGIEALREVLPKLHNSPIAGPYNVLLIEGAEYITIEGWNLLLKTLEEPSRSAIIILVAHSIQDIPKTVLSRVLKLHFLAVPEVEMVNGLEALKYKLPRISEEIPLALGRPGIMIEALRKKKGSNDNATNEMINGLNKSLAERLEQFEKISKNEMLLELDRLMLICRDAALLEHHTDDFLVFPELKDKIKVLNNRSDSHHNLIKKILEAKRQLEHNANPRLVMENIMFQI